MLHGEDTDFNPNAEAERLEAEREAELARKIRREVLRVQSGEAKDDIANDKAQEEEQRAEEEEAEHRERRRKSSAWWLLISGNILVKEGIREYYRYMIAMAVTFFLSIFIMFNVLHLDMKYSRMEGELQLLREKSVRLQELRFRSTSHSSIVSELKARGIEIDSPTTPNEVIE